MNFETVQSFHRRQAFLLPSYSLSFPNAYPLFLEEFLLSKREVMFHYPINWSNQNPLAVLYRQANGLIEFVAEAAIPKFLYESKYKKISGVSEWSHVASKRE